MPKADELQVAVAQRIRSPGRDCTHPPENAIEAVPQYATSHAKESYRNSERRVRVEEKEVVENKGQRDVQFARGQRARA